MRGEYSKLEKKSKRRYNENMHQPIFIANWKMNKTRADAIAFVRAFQKIEFSHDCSIGIAASFPLLPALAEILQNTEIKLAAQNMFYEDAGAFTGEVSPMQVRDAGCSMVILGHSERRHIFGETNDMLNKKIRAAFAHNLTPVYCVGETLEERDAGRAEDLVRTQLNDGLAGIADEQRATMVVAYEPVWAIGTGRNATPDEAQKMHAMIRVMLPETPLLYGGSVKSENAAILLTQPDINGFLVGGASLDAESFLKICQA